MQTRAGGNPQRGSSGRLLPARALGLRCSRERRVWLGIGLLGALWLSPLASLAAQTPPPAPSADAMRAPTPPAGALQHYERGRAEYLAGRYREALIELKAALALDPNSPNLVYNVARVSEDLGELDDAIRYYKQYQTLLAPEEREERDKTQKTIRRLQGAKDELLAQQRQARARGVNSLRRPEPPPQSAGRADSAFWLIASTGLALAAGGGVTGFLALRREEQVRDFVLGKDGTFDARDQLRKEANQFALASDVCLVAAGVTVLTAAMLFFARSSEPSKLSARAAITPRGLGLVVSGSL